jgi:oligopeptidase B
VAVLSPSDAALAAALAADPRTRHLVAGWPRAGVRDAQKRALMARVRAAVGAAVGPGGAGGGGGPSSGASSSSSAALEAARLAVLAPPVAEARDTLAAPPPGSGAAPRPDPYAWLRDDARTDPKVLAHLAAENAYTEAVMADAAGVVEALVAEMRAAIKEADESAPLRKNGYFYYWRTEEGAQYRVSCRRRVAADAAPPSEADAPGPGTGREEVVLDENAEAAGHDFYMAAGATVSPDGTQLAWGVDTVGGELYTLRVRNLATGADVLARPIHKVRQRAERERRRRHSHPIPAHPPSHRHRPTTTATLPFLSHTHTQTAGNYCFSADGGTLFYTTKDALDRPHKVWRHTIGDDPANDACVWTEDDEAFYVHVSRTRDNALLLIQADSALTTEVAALDAATPRGEWKVLFPRKHDTQYEVGHRGGQLVYAVRDAARPNSELVTGPVDDPLGPAARVLVPHSPSEKIEDFVVGASFLAVFKRVDGLQQCFVHKVAPASTTLPAPLKKGARIAFPDPSHELGAGPQGDWDSPVLRLAYSSLTTPASTIDVHTGTGRQATKRVAPVLGGFDPANYKCERLWATSADGTRVPVSLVYRPDLRAAGGGGPQPLLLNAYGAYEACSDAAFGYTQNRLPLLDRGFAFAIAHARGGGELGRAWYEDGKFGKKANTFADVVAAGRFLVEAGWTAPDVLCLEGRSAGGLMVGATLNADPTLFRAAIAGVPFVDVLSTMADDSLPLTVIEKEEWGDPADPAAYAAMAAYSPVDCIVPGGAYPAILATGGLHDPRVGYWEPAKWVATLRARAAPRGPVLLKVDTGAGHFSKSGRFAVLGEKATELAFLLKAVGRLGEKKAAVATV